MRALARVQRMVAAGEAPEAIYPVVVDEAVGLVAADAGSLRLVDPAEPEWMVAVADHGCAGVGERWRRRAPLSEGVSGRVIRTGRPVFVDGASPAIRSSKLAPPGTAIAMGHPVLAAGGVIGCLVTASSAAGREWSVEERRVMAAFAEHVGPALNVARASQAAAQATTDALTGLGTRALLIESLRRRLGGDANEDRKPFLPSSACVLFLDLDGFKLVNDSLGRPAGDRLLEAVAGRVKAATRRADVCARLGGDEFAILLGDPASAETIAARLVQALGQPFAVDGHEVAVSVSVGIADGSGEPEAILRDADLAMDQAKRGGGGRWARFEPGLRAARLSRLDLRTQLRHAIEREELVLHYQPVFHIPTGRVIGFESLVRWKHRERGLVPPLEWIPLAEETGLIVDVDRWVLRTACAQLAEWYRLAPVALSVNVSVCDLEQPDFPQTVAAALPAAGFPPSALVLEMTESISLHESPSVIAQLHAVKAHGVRLALDDFGTKYATLLSLAELPLDVLKIARPFLEFAGESRRNGRGLLGGILEAARHMGMRTIAEGIETEAQHALLIELGCDYGQGFLLGRPMPAPEAERLLFGEQGRPRP